MPLLDFTLTLMPSPHVANRRAGAGCDRADVRQRGARNIAELVLRHVRATPDRIAFVVPSTNSTVSYGQLGARAACFGSALASDGVGVGDRVLVLLPMSVDLYALAIAILARGATLTLVDGRSVRRRLLAAIADARPHAVVAGPAVLRWWPLISVLRRARRFSVGGRTIGCSTLRVVDEVTTEPLGAVDVAGDDAAIVSFTSGSTGRAKPIVRTHRVLVAQHEALAATFPPSPDDVNLPGFPVAALHNLCCGATTLLPPAPVESRRTTAEVVLEHVRRHQVTSLSAAPALLDEMATQVLWTRRPAPTLRRIVVGGGPVSRCLCDRVLRAFPGADAQILYGATEAEPIATVSMTEALVAKGTGFLVGRAAGETQIAIVSRDGAVITPASGRSGAGEIVVRGPHVASGRPNDVGAWHHTGDIGSFDARGRLWLLGRVGWTVHHRGVELAPYAIEAEVLTVEGVTGAALVAHVGAPLGELALSVAGDADVLATEQIVRARLAALGCGALPIRLCAELPMDARHGSKVDREELARRLARSSP